MTAATPYRDENPVYQDIWEWDLVIVHGDVKIIGRNHVHLDHCAFREFGASNCGCDFDQRKVSSPILDRFGKRMRDAPYHGDPVTGDARPLLDAGHGTEIPVMSGKTYRLNGPRRTEQDSYTSGSIWGVYAEADAPEPTPTGWQRFLTWWKS